LQLWAFSFRVGLITYLKGRLGSNLVQSYKPCKVKDKSSRLLKMTY
jgi:hypothetical protein